MQAEGRAEGCSLSITDNDGLFVGTCVEIGKEGSLDGCINGCEDIGEVVMVVVTLLIDGWLLGDSFKHRIWANKSSINVDNSPNEVPSETSPSLLRLLM